MKQDLDENMDGRRNKIDDEEDWEGAEESKHRSSKSQKHNSVEEAQKRDSGRSKSSGDRLDARKKSGSSSQASSGDENDYETKRESRSKIPRKLVDDRSEKRSTEGYRERESESIRKGRDEESERHSSRKSTTKSSSDNDISHNKARGKVERSHESELEYMHDKDSRYTESSEKGHGHRDQARNPTRRRWDEVETSKKAEESMYMDRSDSRGGKAVDHNKHGPVRDRTHDSVDVIDETKSRAVDSSSDKGFRSSSREERRGHGETSKSRGRVDAQDEDNVRGTAPYEARLDVLGDDNGTKVQEKVAEVASKEDAHRSSDQSHVEKAESHRQQDRAHGSLEDVRTRERSIGMDEDRSTQMKDRTGGELRQNKRSRTPERSGRHHWDLDDHDRGLSESDNERSTSFKGKEREREGNRDDRSSKGTDRSWSDRNRDRQGPKDHWRRSQSRQETKDRNESDHVREWESQWHEPEMMDGEKLQSRVGYRRDGRIRTSLASRNANESSDSIEIRPSKNLDFGKEEPSFSGRRAEMGPQQDFPSGVGDETWGYQPEKKGKVPYGYGYGDEPQERYKDDGSPLDQKSLRHSDAHAGEGSGQEDMNYNRTGASQSSDLQQPYGNSQGSVSFGRGPQQGPKGGRPARGRGRLTGRDAPRDGPPLPMMGPPFGHLSLPGPMQSIGPNMPHLPGPPIPPGVFLPPFPGPLIWPGARGVDMNMLAVPPSLSPMPPPGPAGPRFAPNMGSGPNQGMYFNQPGPGRGVATNTSGLGFSAAGPSGRGMPHEKAPNSWGQQRNGGPSKGPSRGEQNDYSQNFVDTGMRPQNFIRELELTSVVEDYPKLRELIQKKDEIVSKSASTPMYYKCDLREHVLSPEFFGTKFDVILVDPPWEEYVHRAPGVTDHMEYWTFEEIQNLKIEAIADTPSFIFLWVGDGMGLEQGRQCLKKWGFRRCEDICWVKTNKANATPSLRHDSHTLFQHSKEHCLMGIKGTVRRSTDGHIIHANIDTDVIIAEEPPYGSTKKPDDLYRIIEHFSLGRRRLELFGEDHNIRSGWLTVGKGLSSSNFNSEAYIKNFSDKDGKVWQGGGGRNPPPEAPHLVQTTPDIENLRPKSPPPKNQPQQSIPLMSSSNSNNRRTMANSPASGPETASPVPWTPSPMGGFRGPDNGVFEGFGFNAPFPQASGDLHEFESH